MSKTIKSLLCAIGLMFAINAQAVTYTYVGSWHVGDGPIYTDNPDVYTGQEAAAFLFGGAAADYAISTISSDSALINFMTFVDGWGDSSHLFSPVAQNYSLDLGQPGYNDIFQTGAAYSAFVLDHSCTARYNDLDSKCPRNDTSINYAFRITNDEVPEPASISLIAIAGAGLLASRRRRVK